MKLSTVFLAILFSLFLPIAAFAQETLKGQEKGKLTKFSKSVLDSLAIDSVNNASISDQLEIDRLIVDETISKAGHEFLELFTASWNWPLDLRESFILVIAERPFRGISTQVIISVNDLVVFESFLQTRYDVLEGLAELALEQTAGYLINYENILKQLAGDDTQGNGIY